jgi:hypothetical protein
MKHHRASLEECTDYAPWYLAPNLLEGSYSNHNSISNGVAVSSGGVDMPVLISLSLRSDPWQV